MRQNSMLHHTLNRLNKTIFILSILAFQLVCQVQAANETDEPAGILGQGTIWATPWYVVESGQEWADVQS